VARDKLVIPWVQENADMVRLWCQENGYKPYTKLRNELQIPAKIWETIMNDARSIIKSVEYYAVIYKKTGFFDPRTIPIITKRIGTVEFTIDRKWTDKMYDDWLNTPNISHPSIIPSETASEPIMLDESTDENPLQWAENFAEAMKDWCDNNGYKTRTLFARQIGLSASAWGGLLSGTHYTNPEVYAKIYLITGLKEADPTTLPPRRMYIPGKKVYEYIPRAWTTEELDAYKAAYKKTPPKLSGKKVLVVRPIMKPAEEPVTTPQVSAQMPVQQVSQPVLNLNSFELYQAFMRSLVAELKPELQPLIKESVGDAMSQFLSDVKSANVGNQTPQNGTYDWARDFEKLSASFADFLRKQSKGTVSERTRFAKLYGRRLTELFPYIEAFSLDDESKREDYLAGIQRLQGGRF